jgi:hypothetical protein
MSNKIVIAGRQYDTSGLTLPEDRNFREFWKAPVDGVVEIDLDTALPAYKSKMSTQVDNDAEAYRLNFITPGDGMSMTYQEKGIQAAAIIALGQTATETLTQQEMLASYPTVLASVGTEGASLWEVANIVHTKKLQWQQLSYYIENKRLTAKAAIKFAETLEEVDTIYNAVVWGA